MSRNSDKDLDTFVNDNPDTNHIDKNIGNRDGFDSPVNKDFGKKSDGKESLTNDESADTDPNEVADKPTFKNDNH
ncbi:hypothetical protein FNO01nite_25000 [Flavobacterium noncentrifugens]|uniref:Uncharacterized protein n=1 Tax=Flavobacterium noncentrifugens TaxID=1128970 RepID=A0A1G8ZX12_9FLAO|nr:hypothetical protein [Flavobacterium noncentrifugens]GEP51828.1 hypothetical protein FNO01nite_25000 [Flavobacterium noncentrifugens]SDK18660.1 hypothetical protein SAMN04487935_2746 [Flavobacterium noncentrifugens]